MGRKRWMTRTIEATDTYDASMEAQSLARQVGGTVDRVRPLPQVVLGSAGQQVQHMRWHVRILLPEDADAS